MRLAEALAARSTELGELQRGLREHHPQAAVRAREISDEVSVVWYVYREGRWIPPEGITEEKG